MPVKGDITEEEKQYIRDRVRIDAETGCWLWTMRLTPQGYGNVTRKGKSRTAHRVSYVAFKGNIPAKYSIVHTCPNNHCVNPEHLDIATKSEIRKKANTSGGARGNDVRRTIP